MRAGRQVRTVPRLAEARFAQNRSEAMSAPKIAVVNDDTQFLRMMQMILEDAGFDAELFFEQDNAYQWLCTVRPDLIILDIRIGAPDGGWIILDLLTLDPKTADIPVIVCSAAHDDLLRKQQFLTDLGVRILLKPFEIDTLLASVHSMLGERRLAD